jgi:hypothetical protein
MAAAWLQAQLPTGLAKGVSQIDGTHDAGSSRQRPIRSRMVAMIGRSLAGR